MIEKTEIVADAWGVIESIKQVKIKKVTPETFWQLYLENNDEYFKLTTAEHNVLAGVLSQSSYYEDKNNQLPGNMFTFNQHSLSVLRSRTGLVDSTIKAALASLVKKGMLLKDSRCRGIYYANPKYFFRGSINDRTKLVTQITQYQFEDYIEKGKEDS